MLLIPLEVPGHTVTHWKALSSGKYEPGGLCFGSIFRISQDVLKCTSLLHNQQWTGLVEPSEPMSTKRLFKTMAN